MDIANPDLFHTDFLRLADSDIRSSSVLLREKEYHNAVYHFQQSVEKSCKYLGLTIKAFTSDELRRIGHEPRRVFDRIFYSETFTAINDNRDYEDIKSAFVGVSLDEKCDGVYYYIDKTFESSSSLNGRSCSEQFIEGIDESLFSALYGTDVLENIKKYRGNPHVEAFCKQFLDKFDEMRKCLLCQMLMSVLVSGIEANSRYPDRKGVSPDKIYSEKSFVVQYLDYFIGKQKFCIKVLRDYFKDCL